MVPVEVFRRVAMDAVCHSAYKYADVQRLPMPQPLSLALRTAMSQGFDAHAHLDMLDPATLEAVWERARLAGVTGVALAGADPRHWDRVRRVANMLGGVWQLGLHPWWAQELEPSAQDAVLARLETELGPHGLGETGLDASRATSHAHRERQERAFARQVAMARARDLPVVLHGVRAWGRVLDTIPAHTEGVLHAFTGSPDLAARAVRQGLHISVGRTILRSLRTQAAVQRIPGEWLLLESDGPDGGEPADLPRLASFVAKLRGEDPQERIAECSRNARRLFRAGGIDATSSHPLRS
jgi:TatD DNase family protein